MNCERQLPDGVVESAWPALIVGTVRKRHKRVQMDHQKRDTRKRTLTVLIPATQAAQQTQSRAAGTYVPCVGSVIAASPCQGILEWSCLGVWDRDWVSQRMRTSYSASKTTRNVAF